jgi:hypothetical protein
LQLQARLGFAEATGRRCDTRLKRTVSGAQLFQKDLTSVARCSLSKGFSNAGPITGKSRRYRRSHPSRGSSRKSATQLISLNFVEALAKKVAETVRLSRGRSGTFNRERLAKSLG